MLFSLKFTQTIKLTHTKQKLSNINDDQYQAINGNQISDNISSNEKTKLGNRRPQLTATSPSSSSDDSLTLESFISRIAARKHQTSNTKPKSSQPDNLPSITGVVPLTTLHATFSISQPLMTASATSSRSQFPADSSPSDGLASGQLDKANSPEKTLRPKKKGFNSVPWPAVPYSESPGKPSTTIFKLGNGPIPAATIPPEMDLEEWQKNERKRKAKQMLLDRRAQKVKAIKAAETASLAQQVQGTQQDNQTQLALHFSEASTIPNSIKNKSDLVDEFGDEGLGELQLTPSSPAAVGHSSCTDGILPPVIATAAERPSLRPRAVKTATRKRPDTKERRRHDTKEWKLIPQASDEINHRQSFASQPIQHYRIVKVPSLEITTSELGLKWLAIIKDQKKSSKLSLEVKQVYLHKLPRGPNKDWEKSAEEVSLDSQFKKDPPALSEYRRQQRMELLDASQQQEEPPAQKEILQANKGPALAVDGLDQPQKLIHPAAVQPADVAQPTTSSPPNPNKLSPTNLAKKDAEFSVLQFVSNDQTIQSADSDMFLKWNGKTEQTLKVVKGDQEKLSFEFQSIVKIAYNPTEQYLQINYADDGKQMVVFSMKVPPESWSELQQFCRRVEKKWKAPCDMQEPSFFKDTIENLKKNRNKTKKNTTCRHTPERQTREAECIPQTTSSQKPKGHTATTSATKTIRRQAGAKPKSQSVLTSAKNDKDIQHLIPEIMNIMAAKLRDKPLTLPQLVTPKKPYCPTDDLLAKTSQSISKSSRKIGDESKAQKPQAVNETEESKVEDLKDRGSPVQRSLSINRRRLLPLGQNPTDTGSPFQLRPPSEDGSRLGLPNLSSPSSPTKCEAIHQNPQAFNDIQTPGERHKQQLNAAKASMNVKNVKKTSGQQPRPPLNELASECMGRKSIFDRRETLVAVPAADMGITSPMSTSPPSHMPSPKPVHPLSHRDPAHNLPEILEDLSAIKKDNQKSESITDSAATPLSISRRPSNFSTKRPTRDDRSSDNLHKLAKKNKPSTPKKSSGRGLFYGKQRFMIPVAIGDLVVRLRNQKDMEEFGKYDKYDVFDGPWSILEIAEKQFTVDEDIINTKSSDEDGNMRKEWEQMLATEVKLNFPQIKEAKSEAHPWVPINRLLPILDSSSLVTGKLYPSNPSVASADEYLHLIEALRSGSASLGQLSENSPVKKKASKVSKDSVDVVELRTGIFVAVVYVLPDPNADATFEVEKIRNKRLRLYSKSEAKRLGVRQDNYDKWTRILLKVSILFLLDPHTLQFAN